MYLFSRPRRLLGPNVPSVVDRMKGAMSSLLEGGSIAERWRKYTAEDQKVTGVEVYRKMQSKLLEGELWTFYAFRMYNLQLYDLYGGNKGKAKPEQKRDELDEDYAGRLKKWEQDLAKSQDPAIRSIRQKLRILDAMNPVELASNHKSIFTRSAKKLIAQKAKVAFKDVDELLLEHDGLRADRKWFMTRQALNLPLPSTMEERERWATLDRPFSRTEMELAKAHQEERMKSARRKTKAPKRITSYVFRTPSKGISRWNRNE
jgi:hypothetical protein